MSNHLKVAMSSVIAEKLKEVVEKELKSLEGMNNLDVIEVIINSFTDVFVAVYMSIFFDSNLKNNILDYIVEAFKIALKHKLMGAVNEGKQ